jgi:hypothetical protein
VTAVNWRSKRPALNWRSKRQVLALIVGVVLLMMLGGMAAAWHNRDNSTCRDRKPPLEQRGGILGQLLLRCHDGQIVTIPG